MENNKDAIRLNSVKRVDPHVVSIVDCALRTALYNYEQEGGSWSKPEVEGTLMLYTREAPPYNMLIIINKLSKSNFLEPLISACDIQVKPPYLLFRSCKGAIYGIWFSEQDDVHRISSAISERIARDTQPTIQAAQIIMNDPAVGLAVGGPPKGDIMSMLSQAHGVFESKKQEPTYIINTVTGSNSDIVKPSPLRADESTTTTNTVADFFAKVGISGLAGPSTTALHSPSSAVPNASPSSTTTNPVLQRLFQDAAAIGGQASVAVTVGSGVTAPISIPGQPLQAHSSQLSSSVPPNMPMSLEELEGKLKENLQITSLSTKDEQQFVKSPPTATSLLSPQVFTSQTLSNKVDTTQLNQPNFLTPGTCLAAERKSHNGTQESLHETLIPNLQSHKISPLTQEQLVKAFSILLKKDEFVHQLHEAYVQALTQSLKGCI